MGMAVVLVAAALLLTLGPRSSCTANGHDDTEQEQPEPLQPVEREQLLVTVTREPPCPGEEEGLEEFLVAHRGCAFVQVSVGSGQHASHGFLAGVFAQVGVDAANLQGRAGWANAGLLAYRSLDGDVHLYAVLDAARGRRKWIIGPTPQSETGWAWAEDAALTPEQITAPWWRVAGHGGAEAPLVGLGLEVRCYAKPAARVQVADGPLSTIFELSSAPRVRLVEDFMSVLEVDEIVGEGSLEDLPIDSRYDPSAWSTGSARATGAENEVGERLMLPVDHWLVHDVVQRAAFLFDVPVEWVEVQGWAYNEGDCVLPRHDWWEPEQEPALYRARVARDGGQRTASLLVFLSETESGGELVFNDLGAVITPTPGLAVLWHNRDARGSLDDSLVYQLNPIRKGDLMVLRLWAREGPVQQQR